MCRTCGLNGGTHVRRGLRGHALTRLREDAVARVEQFVNDIDQLVRETGLGHERIATGTASPFRVARERMPGERDDQRASGARIALETPGRLPAIHQGQRQVHEDDVGHVLEGLVQRFLTITRLGNAKP